MTNSITEQINNVSAPVECSGCNKNCYQNEKSVGIRQTGFSRQFFINYCKSK